MSRKKGYLTAMDARAATASEPAQTRSNRSEGFSFRTYLLSFAMGIILYVLSPGPVAKALTPRTFSAFIAPSPLGQAIDITYAPLNYCYDHFPAVHRFYDWYVGKVWHAE